MNLPTPSGSVREACSRLILTRAFYSSIRRLCRNRKRWKRQSGSKALECGSFTPAAEGHGLCPWMNTPAFGRDVAPLGPEVGFHGLCPWGSTMQSKSFVKKVNEENARRVG